MRWGATALPGTATVQTVAAFPKITYMRDFGKDGPDDDSLPELPAHGQGKWLTKPDGCLLHVSWKDDVEELTAWLDGLWEDVWLTVWHEPHGDVTPDRYRATAARAVEIVANHPNGHFVQRIGPVVTRYWLVSKGGDPLDWWVPGFNLYGIDFYLDTSQFYRTAEDMFAAALNRVRAALPGVDICIPEYGLKLIGDDDGTLRAQVMREHAAWLRSQPDVIAVGWWDIGGNRITGKQPEQDTWTAVLEEGNVAWYLNRALTNLRAEVNAAFPNRDKTSDGTIGDAAHQNTASDHNPDPDGSVDAWDMDVDLKSGNDAAEIERLKGIFEAHPASRYWIHNRQIASRSNGWVREPYGGANPHDKHVHWNTREGYEDSPEPWGVEEDDMPSAEEIKTAILSDGGIQQLLSRVEGLVSLRASIARPGDRTEANQLAAALAALAARPPVEPAPVDPAAVKAALLDPEVLQAIAAAVNADASSRLAS